MQVVSLACVALVLLVTFTTAAPRVRRSTDEAASSYFYFSRTPGHAFPGGVGVPSLSTLPTETKAFFPSKVLKSVSEFNADDGEFGKGLTDSDEAGDHEAYRVVEEEEDGGASHEQGHHALGDSRREHGYDKKHVLELASKGGHGKEDHSHHYAQDGSRKKSQHDEGSHYHDHHHEAKHTKGGKHHEKKHHKKGSKTTGYHNVYHKDEYKKEHVFYDTSDHTGQFKKYGSAHEHHSNEAGQHAKGGHEERAQQEASYRKAGGKDQGKYDQHHKEFQHAHGKEQHDRAGSHYEQQHGHAGTGERGYEIIHQ